MAKNLKIELKTLTSQIYDNALNDRERAIILYEDLASNMNQLTEHAAVGTVAAKYLERLNKSNDQLIKLSELLQSDKQLDKKLLSQRSDEETNAIFEIIKEATLNEHSDDDE